MGGEAAVTYREKRGTLTEDAGLGTGPVPLDPYRTQAFFELERDRIFRRAWLILGRAEEIPAPGDYFVKPVDPCGVSALVTRDKTGRIQAFHNSCSHRGSAVVPDNTGNRTRFVCPYHKWTYGIDGRLVGIVDEGNFFDVDKARCGLKKIATEVWEGWIFVNLQPEPEVSLERFLGDFRDHFTGFHYQGVDTPVVFTADLDANWKVVSDAFIESYHIPAIHPETLGDTFANRNNPHSRILSAKVMGPHRHVSMFGNPEFSLDPAQKAQALAFAERPAGSVIAAASKKEAIDFLAHPAINPTGSPDWSMDVNQIFPHTQIDCGPGGFWVHQFWPKSPNTSRYEGRFYMRRAESMRERYQQELYISRVIEVILEDLVNVGRTQLGIDSGGQTHMQLQDSEVGIRHSVEACLRWAEAETVEKALA